MRITKRHPPKGRWAMADKKSDTRKRDEAAMKYSGETGRTFFLVCDLKTDTTRSFECGAFDTQEAALLHKVAGQRLYHRVAKNKYRLVG